MFRTVRPAFLSSSRAPCLLHSTQSLSATFHTSAPSYAFKVRGPASRKAPKQFKSKGRVLKFGNTTRTRLAKDIRPKQPWKASADARSGQDISNPKPSEKPSSQNSIAEIEALLDEEFDRSIAEPIRDTPQQFTSPPLLPAIHKSLVDVLGADVGPTPIQALAVKHMLDLSKEPESWKQFLLASETGSGKSIAYLLPVLQYLKETEGDREPSKLPISPRALILSPTHELSRQLSSTAKSLLHNAKMRVQCASRANVPTQTASARQMKQVVQAMSDSGEQGVSSSGGRAIDLLTSTPMKALEMVRGWGWDRVGNPEFDRDGRKFRAGKPTMSLKEVECVVIDEADILFDKDFKDTTLAFLSDISAARGQPVPSNPASIRYPFHLILTSATVPSSMSSYLSKHHPSLTRLASPNVHRLPDNLFMEHVRWSGVNRYSDIEKRLRRVWAEDALRGASPSKKPSRSRVLVFCNRTGAVEALSSYLEQKGIANVALTKTAKDRTRGSNKHLAGFLKDTTAQAGGKEGEEEPHVLITTSLLSRGLDFDSSVQHVFIVDTPRNMIDFIHRAGRAGRAGHHGKVVVFGKLKGRGSAVDVETKKKLKALTR